MEAYNKLVRDKIPDILKVKGVPFESHVASPEEYKAELIKKLGEEFEEYEAIQSTEELGDIIEVIEALKKLPEYADVEEVRQHKLEERGGFQSRIIVKGEKD